GLEADLSRKTSVTQPRQGAPCTGRSRKSSAQVRPRSTAVALSTVRFTHGVATLWNLTRKQLSTTWIPRFRFAKKDTGSDTPPRRLRSKLYRRPPVTWQSNGRRTPSGRFSARSDTHGFCGQCPTTTRT